MKSKFLSRGRVLAALVAAIVLTAGWRQAAAQRNAPTKVDLNTATAAQLEDLPGIGAANAKKIIAARPYKSVDDLSRAGIPASTLTKISPLITVTATEPAPGPGRLSKSGPTAKE